MKDASEQNAKGDHLYFDPVYKSEYKKCYDEQARAKIHEYMARQTSYPEPHLLDDQQGLSQLPQDVALDTKAVE